MDAMGVPGGPWSARVAPKGQGERHGCPRGSARTLGVSQGQGGRRGGQGDVKVSQEVKTGVPGGRRKSRGSKGVKRYVCGVTGAQGSARDI